MLVGPYLCSTVIFPFVPQFVRDTGITGGDERKTGYWAGVLVSTPLTQWVRVHVATNQRYAGIRVLRGRIPVGILLGTRV